MREREKKKRKWDRVRTRPEKMENGGQNVWRVLMSARRAAKNNNKEGERDVELAALNELI